MTGLIRIILKKQKKKKINASRNRVLKKKNRKYFSTYRPNINFSFHLFTEAHANILEGEKLISTEEERRGRRDSLEKITW